MSRADDAARGARGDRLAQAARDAVDDLTGGPDADRPPAVPAVDARARLQRELTGLGAAKDAIDHALDRGVIAAIDVGAWDGRAGLVVREEAAVVDYLQTWQRRKTRGEIDSGLSSRLAREALAEGHDLLEEVREDEDV